MNAETLVQRYFDGWNKHDAAAIVSTFANGGTYSDPTTPGPVSGEAIGQNAAQLWAAFPDVHFEVGSFMASPGRFAAEWVMTGTNTGPFAGLPPSGRKVVLNGADFIEASDAGIRSVQGYFDAGQIPRQLDMQVIAQPRSLGPFTFGTGIRVGGQSTEQPGAISITSLIARNEKDVQAVSNYSQQIAAELPSVKGFLGLVAATIGERMITITAWRDPDDSQQLMRGGKHVEASRAFYGPDVAGGGWTGIFTPHRINSVWTRCRECGTMTRREPEVMNCKCGAALSPSPSYW